RDELGLDNTRDATQRVSGGSGRTVGDETVLNRVKAASYAQCPVDTVSGTLSNDEAEASRSRNPVALCVGAGVDLADCHAECGRRCRGVSRNSIARDEVRTSNKLRGRGDAVDERADNHVVVSLHAHVEHVAGEAVDEAERVVHATL